MTKVYLSKTFIDSSKMLDKSEKKAALKTICKMKLYNLHPSLNEEIISNGFKSARVNKDIRIIFMEEENTKLLLYIAHHQNAYLWAETHKLSFSTCNTLYIEDLNFKIDDLELITYNESIFEAKGIKLDIIKIIVGNELFAKKLYYLSSPNDVFFFLTSNNFIDEVKEAIMALLNGTKADDVLKAFTPLNTTSSLSYLLQRNISKRRFFLLEDEYVLSKIFGDNFESWQIFLHPSQAYLVTKHYRGAAVIEGGPGTGKTVVGMHRALYLAKNVYNQKNNRILLCTYSKKLAENMIDKFKRLAEVNNIDVSNVEIDYVGSVFRNILDNYKISYEGYDDTKHDQEMIFRVKNFKGRKFHTGFYVREYDEIIQPNRINNLDEYMKFSRKGMAIRITRKQREDVWKLMEYFIDAKKRYKILNHEDVAMILEKAIDEKKVEPIYDSIIVDEAQDLSPNKLRVFKKLLRTKEDNLLLLSDKEQRIFKIDSYRKKTGLKIVGRTFYLTLNYRSSKAIFDFASHNLSKYSRERYSYKLDSLFCGEKPQVFNFESVHDQMNKLIEDIKILINCEKYNGFEICVVSNHNEKLKTVSNILSVNHITNTLLNNKIFPNSQTGVCLSSCIGVKGLEFRAIFFIDYDYVVYNTIPINGLHERIRYVACTRAREKLVILNEIN